MWSPNITIFMKIMLGRHFHIFPTSKKIIITYLLYYNYSNNSKEVFT
jgi:hypothetical protein